MQTKKLIKMPPPCITEIEGIAMIVRTVDGKLVAGPIPASIFEVEFWNMLRAEQRRNAILRAKLEVYRCQSTMNKQSYSAG